MGRGGGSCDILCRARGMAGEAGVISVRFSLARGGRTFEQLVVP